MAERNSYIVTKALNSYLKGSVIIAISSHLVTTTDAVVVSWLIGSKAFTAVNVVIPVLAVYSAIMIMLSTGASIIISKAIGNRDKDVTNLAFSASIVGAVVFGSVASLFTYKFVKVIIHYLVHGDPALFMYGTEYLKTFCYAIPVLIVVGVIGNIVRTDGNTRLISIAVWIGIIANIILDIVFIKYLNLGIAGAAWATAINYILALVICLFHFLSRSNTLKWSWEIKYYLSFIFKSCRLGFSTSLNTLLLGLSLFVINGLMLHYVGSEGIYCWAVCYQIFLIVQMILSGIDTSIFAIGGLLLGEEDVTGLTYLYRRSVLYLVIAVLLLSALIIIFPEFFGTIFGNRGEDKLDLLPKVLKIFSLFLLPYSLSMQVRAIYTIIGRSILSLFICISVFALMILLVYITCMKYQTLIWWSFPVSSWLLLVSIFIYTAIIHLCNKSLRIFSLIPEKIGGPIYNVSIGLNETSVNEVEDGMTTFLKDQNVSDSLNTFSVEYTGEIMERMLKRLLQEKKKRRYFDINVRIKEGKIIVILKDDGKRIDRDTEKQIVSGYNQIKDNSNSDKDNKVSLTTSYFYMNEQNMFTLNFAE